MTRFSIKKNENNVVLKQFILSAMYSKANLFFPFMTPHPPNPVKIYLYNLT